MFFAAGFLILVALGNSANATKSSKGMINKLGPAAQDTLIVLAPESLIATEYQGVVVKNTEGGLVAESL